MLNIPLNLLHQMPSSDEHTVIVLEKTDATEAKLTFYILIFSYKFVIFKCKLR